MLYKRNTNSRTRGRRCFVKDQLTFYDDNDVNHKLKITRGNFRQSMYVNCSNPIAKQNQETARFIKKNFAPKEETNMKCLRNSSEVKRR